MLRSWLLLEVALAFQLGCSSSSSVSTSEPVLTIEQWKQLPKQIKYEIDTFEQLKRSDSKLMELPVWNKLYREVILPAKKVDFPNKK